MRIDAHQHFWRYDPEQYGWMTDGMEVLRRDYLPDELEPELESFGMAGSIVVQARQDLDETKWLLKVAGERPHVLGVVGWVDLCSEHVDQPLEELADDFFFKGVRHVLQDEKDDEFMLREDFRRGIGKLIGYGLAYDLLIYPRHLSAAARLVDEFPAQPFALDHMAKPSIKDGEIREWEDGIRALAARPNVSCKVSGLVTEARWNDWLAEDFFPYLDVVFEAFGEDRVMFGSDWPVCLLSSDYASMANILVEYGRKLSDTARAKLFGLNAVRFYRID